MNRIHKWRIAFLKSIQLQLFLTLISLPFLIAWGLPLSLLSPLATLLFTPFIAVFLLLSSLIFFLELVYLPSTWVIYALDVLTGWWISIINTNYSWWLIGFRAPSLLFLIAIPLITCLLIHSRHITTITKRIAYLATLLLIICCICRFFPYSYNTVETIIRKQKTITLINHHNTLILIDSGAFSSHKSYESWINYTFIPELIQKTGQLHIDHLILCTINQRIFDAVHFLSSKITIDYVYVPWWTDKIPSFAWQSYINLKKALSDNRGRITSISKKRSIFIDKDASLSIEPDEAKKIRYYNATYPLMNIDCSITKEIVWTNRK